MKNPANPADGTFVVVENGQRVSAPLPTAQAAQAEADQRNRVQESSGQPALPEGKRAQVKVNLMG